MNFLNGWKQVVAAQLDALQRNDWPEADAGISVAFAFSKPHGAESLLPGEVRSNKIGLSMRKLSILCSAGLTADVHSAQCNAPQDFACFTATKWDAGVVWRCCCVGRIASVASLFGFPRPLAQTTLCGFDWVRQVEGVKLYFKKCNASTFHALTLTSWHLHFS